MRQAVIFAVVASATLGLAVTACAPVLRTHGYVPQDGADQNILVNVDTKQTLEARLGHPSTTGVFEDTWYYITATREDFAYLRPRITSRRIVAVQFDDQGRVSNVDEFDVGDGREISVVSRETPTRGRSVGLLEQIFGNIGQIGASQLPGRMDTVPDGAGGPSPF